MKRFFLTFFALLVLFILSLLPASAADEPFRVYLNAIEIEFDVPPQNINDRIMVPIRAIFEAMGAGVEWQPETRSAFCTKDDTTVVMTLDSTEMSVNGECVTMDVAPVAIDGRILAPARYVAEAFGADVQWSQKNRSVVISTAGVYAYADYPDVPDLGRCYDLPLSEESVQSGHRTFSYLFTDFEKDEQYSNRLDYSALLLGDYRKEVSDYTDGVLTLAYTKPQETEPRFFIAASAVENGSMRFTLTLNTIVLYAPDGRTIDVPADTVDTYLGFGWYETQSEAAEHLTATGHAIWQSGGCTYVDGILIANKTYSLPATYAPGGLTAECLAAYREMQSAAASDGVTLTIVSGYRSYSKQQSLYNRYVAQDGQKAADRYSARPGHSEHQTGLAMDLNSVSDSFAFTKAGIWLAAHCHEYGFIIRYPKGKEAQTGYKYEPWHVRYVGRELAGSIAASGLCLEEYFGIPSAYP